MKSQTLVIDLVRNWLPTATNEIYMHTTQPYFDVAVVNSEPEYPGLEKIQGKVIWPYVETLDNPTDPAIKDAVHQTVRKFCKHLDARVTRVLHEEQVTYIEFKLAATKNVEDLKWLDADLIEVALDADVKETNRQLPKTDDT